jgi:hypothetical protein
MRPIRFPALALVVCAALAAPRALAAQQAIAPWQDSWYWGAYGGQTTFATSIARTYGAPTIGVDWVITRTRVALNVFAEQSYFNAVSTVPDFPTSAPRRVDIVDMRRVGFAAMVFGPDLGMVKPYAGFGWSFNFIKEATPQGTSFASAAARDSVLKRIDDARSAGKLFGDIGFMLMYKKFAPFVQYTVMPTQGAKSSLINGDGFTNVWKAGLRYNFGSAIEKKPW